MTVPTTPITTYNRRAVHPATGTDGASKLSDWLKTELLTIQRAIFRPTTITVTANYTLLPSDDVVLVDATTGPVTVTLLDPTRAQHVTATVKKIDSSSNAVTFATTIASTATAGTFDGATSPTLVSQWDARTYRSNGMEYYALTDTTPAVFVGTVPAANVSAGTFGASVGGGDYTFPAILTVVGAINGTGAIVTRTTDFNSGTNTGTQVALTLGASTGSTFAQLDALNAGTSVPATLKLNPNGGPITMGGSLAVVGNVNINSGKFTVDASTGNTVVAGTLGVTGAVALSNQLNFASNIGILAPSGNGQGSAGVTTALGLTLIGQGSSNDFVLFNKNVAPVIVVATGTQNVAVSGTISASNFSGSSSGTNTGDQTTISGNAGTATKLATAQNIWGQSFDGSAAISGTLSGASTIDASSDIKTTGGNLIVRTAGNGLLVGEGLNATMGAAILSTGTVTVATTKVTNVSRIFISRQNDPSSLGVLPVDVVSRVAGTSFTIQSSNVLDNATVAWVILEPA